jgi:hypothetical protein
MTEEQKVPAVVGKPPMPWEKRVETMSNKNLEGECRKIAKEAQGKINGALADVLLICFFKAPRGGNDPYMLETRTTKFYDIWKSMKGA